jgi:hypothetical protein
MFDPTYRFKDIIEPVQAFSELNALSIRELNQAQPAITKLSDFAQRQNDLFSQIHQAQAEFSEHFSSVIETINDELDDEDGLIEDYEFDLDYAAIDEAVLASKPEALLYDSALKIDTLVEELDPLFTLVDVLAQTQVQKSFLDRTASGKNKKPNLIDYLRSWLPFTVKGKAAEKSFDESLAEAFEPFDELLFANHRIVIGNILNAFEKTILSFLDQTLDEMEALAKRQDFLKPLADLREKIIEKLKENGFEYVAIKS